MGHTVSADAASNPHVCEHEQSGNATAGCSIHPAAQSNYQQPFQVPDGVQGEKHCVPALFKCHPCCQASLVHLSSPDLRWCILGSCRVLVGGGEINAQSGAPATWLLHPTHRMGDRVTLAAVSAGRVSWQHGAALPEETAWGGCDKPCCLQWHCPNPGTPPEHTQLITL